MSRFGWDPGLETGDAQIDEQHRELFVLCGRFADAIDDGRGEDAVEETLFEMLRYAASHFALEEQLMESSAYPNSEQHRQAHAKFRERAQEFAQQYVRGEQVSVDELYQYLTEWLVMHVTYEDRELVEHVRGA